MRDNKNEITQNEIKQSKLTLHDIENHQEQHLTNCFEDQKKYMKKMRKFCHTRGANSNGLHRVLVLATLVVDVKGSVSECQCQYLTRKSSVTNM